MFLLCWVSCGVGWTGQALLADQLLLARGRQVDVFCQGMRFDGSDLRIDIPIQSCRESNLRILDEQVVELIAELDELLLCWGLFRGVVHTLIVLGFLWCCMDDITLISIHRILLHPLHHE